MLQKQRLRIAIQKKGRLFTESTQLLRNAGLKFRTHENALISRVENLPIDILLVRDDDIPTLVMDDICDVGIVGENVLLEKEKYQQNMGSPSSYELISKLGFGNCRLSIAFPQERNYTGINALAGLRIATSYPNLLQAYLKDNNVEAHVLAISGSVEITPRLGMADAICDLVSTGRTLEENDLNEVAILTASQAVLIRTKNPLEDTKLATFELLFRRIQGVLSAQESKYIMFHLPKDALDAIRHLLPGCETPTILPLDGYDDKLAVHVVSREGVFWGTLERLKQAGASSILVLPIEKMLA